MRLAIIVAAAVILAPAVLSAHPAAAGYGLSDVSAAAKKKAKKPGKKKEENLKAAPGTGPSGPATKY